jgi:S-adenosylmethionine:tRNA ribosyltransferase-isomerase
MDSPDLQLASYLYDLPEELIAQTPVTPRDRSRLLVVDGGGCDHRQFYQISELLKAGDLLVFNDTKVIPARLLGHKESGAQVEVLLLHSDGEDVWTALVKPGKKIQIGNRLIFRAEGQPDLVARVVDRDEPTGGRRLRFDLPAGQTLLEVLDNYGEIPFPPYVTASQATVEQYQTVYASSPGSVAAPTAGLHFTPELLASLAEQGVQQAKVTLHVGVGTFRPVTAAVITDHEMHSEWLTVPLATVDRIQETQARGGRVIAVGTTTVRSLETAAQSGQIQPYRGVTNIFIYPGYQWQVVDSLITNFHLPGSSLMMLVGAAIGRQNLLDIYQQAIQERYRFYSFGDAMFIPLISRSPRIS